jgi:hypothetical protein
MLRSIPFRNLNPAETGRKGREGFATPKTKQYGAMLRISPRNQQ